MINIKDQIPSIYYDASRDFQILGHLFEVVLNYSKTNADMLYLLPTGLDVDSRATELLAFTLGFKLRRNYDKEQLAALVSIFPRLLKMKGTLQAVNLLGNALVKASGIPGTFESVLEDYVLTIRVPQELTDITLFLDLLPYIIPFGIRVSVVRTTILRQNFSTSVGTSAIVRKVLPGKDLFAIGAVGEHPLGLADSTTSGITADYSAIRAADDGTLTAAVGLLATSPIITLDATVDKEEN